MQADEKPHILVVDDDDRLRALIVRYLRDNGFAVSQAVDAKAARALLGLFVFDLMVLDVMMPGETGLELAEALRSVSAPPVLMLSALGTAGDRVAGLEVGVDDYLAKPFEPKELVLRVRAIIRRNTAMPASPPAAHINFGDFSFDPETGQLHKGSENVYLTSAEITLLSLLAAHVSQPVSREVLAEKLGLEADNARSVDVQVTRLRKKIEPDGPRPHYIQTVRGQGYRLQGSRA